MGELDLEVILESPRKFRVWKYTVSHSMLLLRSIKTHDLPTRIDVLFVDVEHVDIPTNMDGLTISGTGRYLLSGRDWHGSVIALCCRVSEDDGEYVDPSGFHEGSGI